MRVSSSASRIISLAAVTIMLQVAIRPASSTSYEPPDAYPRRVMFEEWGYGRETMDSQMRITRPAGLEKRGWRVLRSSGGTSFRMILDSSEPMLTVGYPGNTTAFNGSDTVRQLHQRASGGITEETFPSHGPEFIPHPDLDFLFHERLRQEVRDGSWLVEAGPVPCSLGSCTRLTRSEIIDKPPFGATYESWPWQGTGDQRVTTVLYERATRFISERRTTLNGQLIDRLSITCHDLPGSGQPCPPDFYFDEVVDRTRPIAHWRLSEAAGPFMNSVQGGPQGVGSGTLGRAVTGALGGEGDGAVSFDSGSIEVVSPALDSEALTLEAWVRVADVSATRPLIERWDTEVALTATRSSDISLPLKGNGYGLRLATGGVLTGFALSPLGRVDVASPPAAITPGEWTHIALTISGSGRLVVFVDGRPVGAAGSSFERSRTSAPFKIGAAGGPPSGSVRAVGLEVDEVSVFASVLPDHELFEHWTTGVGEADF